MIHHRCSSAFGSTPVLTLPLLQKCFFPQGLIITELSMGMIGNTGQQTPPPSSERAPFFWHKNIVFLPFPVYRPGVRIASGTSDLKCRACTDLLVLHITDIAGIQVPGSSPTPHLSWESNVSKETPISIVRSKCYVISVFEYHENQLPIFFPGQNLVCCCCYHPTKIFTALLYGHLRNDLPVYIFMIFPPPCNRFPFYEIQHS